MQEKVTAISDDFPGVVTQHGYAQNSLGLGVTYSDRHFIDSMYGDPNVLEAIGKLLCDRANREDSPIRIVGNDPGALKSSRQELGRMVLDSVTGSAPYDGLWTWLDRPGVNRLIRLLRKGRDATFGRDE